MVGAEGGAAAIAAVRQEVERVAPGVGAVLSGGGPDANVRHFAQIKSLVQHSPESILAEWPTKRFVQPRQPRVCEMRRVLMSR